MDEFDSWLLAKGIDCIGMTAELRAVLIRQWEAEQPQPVERPSELLLIPDDCDQWGRAIRLEVASCN